MTLFGLPSLVINSDTCSEAQKSGRDLWVEAQTRYTMIFLSPEELTTRSFTQLLEQNTGGVSPSGLLFDRFPLCVHIYQR